MSAYRKGLDGGWEPSAPTGGQSRRGASRPHARPATGRPSSAHSPAPAGSGADDELEVSHLPDHPLAPSDERDAASRVDNPAAMAAGLAMLLGGADAPPTTPSSRSTGNGNGAPPSSARVSIFGRPVQDAPPAAPPPTSRATEPPPADAPDSRFARPSRREAPPVARAPEGPPPSLFGRAPAPPAAPVGPTAPPAERPPPGVAARVEPGVPTIRRFDPRDRPAGPGGNGRPDFAPPGPAAPSRSAPPGAGRPGSTAAFGAGAATMSAGASLAGAPQAPWGTDVRPGPPEGPAGRASLPPPPVGGLDLRAAGARAPQAPPPLLAPERGANRLFAVPNATGPRTLLGLAWFAVLVPAVMVGTGAMAMLFGGVAAAAAWGTARSWQRRGYEPDHRVAAGAALAVSAIAAVHVSLAGVVLGLLPFVAMLATSAAPSTKVRRPPMMGTVGAFLRSVVPACVAVIGVMLVARSGAWVLLVFVLLVSAYDAGSFLLGAEARTPIPGIVGGVLCTVVVGVPLMVSQLPPFDGRPVGLVFAALIGVVAPLGQMVASLSLPAAAEWVGPLRRLDAYIVAGPVFAWVVAQFLAAG
jgi:CDP-diglyceride synthetase